MSPLILFMELNKHLAHIGPEFTSTSMNKRFESDQSQGSLMNHWLRIQHDVNMFCGCISKMEARN
jgi:hypothetical protein